MCVNDFTEADIVREKTDKRVIKTKEKLVNTFMKLLSERDFENITVNELCETADVRRATFYKHFTDKYDFFKYVVTTLRTNFDEEWGRTKSSGIEAYFTKYAFLLIDFFDENEKVIKNICRSPVSSAMLSILISENFYKTRAVMDAAKSMGKLYAHSTDVLSSMLVGGVFHALLNWIISKKQMPKEELKREISDIISKITE
jgi:AcrR family transcriptional regulator